ncbi:phosphoglycerate kinase [Fibrobacterota bacterium]
MAKLFIEDLELRGKKVITRVDFNVPLEGGKVDNDKRLRASLPTIKYLMDQGAKIILMSHLGRPKGQVVEEMRMAPVAEALGALLGREVKNTTDCVGEEVKTVVGSLGEGEILLLENLRFHKAETENDPGFAQDLASLADIYINDAFGTAHRAHASTEGITRFFSQCACGYLIKKEIEFLGEALNDPQKPFVAIIGGAKISGKIDVMEALLAKVDTLLIGGGMAYTFSKAQGLEIGKSLFEPDKLELAGKLLERSGGKIRLPVDSVVTDELDVKGRTVGSLETVPQDQIPAGAYAVDIGPQTIEQFSGVIEQAKTLVWNGPMGVFEIGETAKGTYEIANALVRATAQGAASIIGGGDSASAIEKGGLADKVTHVSTGGGASLEFLEGKKLPGIEALTEK